MNEPLTKRAKFSAAVGNAIAHCNAGSMISQPANCPHPESLDLTWSPSGNRSQWTSSQPDHRTYDRRWVMNESRDTRPFVNEPNNTRPFMNESHNTRPFMSERHNTRPFTNEPHNTGQFMNEPHSTRPFMNKPHHSRTFTNEQHQARTLMNEPHHTRPLLNEPHRSNAFMNEPHHTRPLLNEPHHARPFMNEPYHCELFMDEQHHARPFTNEPHHTRPFTNEPHHARPFTNEPLGRSQTCCYLAAASCISHRGDNPQSNSLGKGSKTPVPCEPRLRPGPQGREQCSPHSQRMGGQDDPQFASPSNSYPPSTSGNPEHRVKTGRLDRATTARALPVKNFLGARSFQEEVGVGYSNSNSNSSEALNLCVGKKTVVNAPPLAHSRRVEEEKEKHPRPPRDQWVTSIAQPDDVLHRTGGGRFEARVLLNGSVVTEATGRGIQVPRREENVVYDLSVKKPLDLSCPPARPEHKRPPPGHEEPQQQKRPEEHAWLLQLLTSCKKLQELGPYA